MGSFTLAVHLYVNYLTPELALKDTRSEYSDDVPIPSLVGHVIGGFLVGLGTKLGNGCTTGHGICGLSRFSLRSLAAVCTFMATSIGSKFLVSPTRPWAAMTSIIRQETIPVVTPLASTLFMTAMVVPAMLRPTQKTSQNESSKSYGAAISGMLFAAGLSISGMTQNSKVHDFLCFSNFSNGMWNPTLMAVMAGGIGASWISYQLIKDYATATNWGTFEHPICLRPSEDGNDAKFNIPNSNVIDARLLTGAAIFGLGWGLTGICPGPALYAAAAGNVDAIIGWIPSFLVGSFVGTKVIANVFEKKDNTAKKAA